MALKRFIATLAAGAFAAAALSVGAARAECQFAKVADLPVTMQGLRPLITTKINGEDAKFLLDSGAFYSNLTDAAAEHFKLATHQAPFGFRVGGIGHGTVTPRTAVVSEFVYAGVPLKNIEFLVFGRAPAAGAAGIIGQNLLRSSEIEFDLANGVIRLFHSVGCDDKANFAYWSKGKDLKILSIRAQTPLEPHIIADATIDGKAIKVMFDTGASTSVIDRGAAARAGIRMTSEGVTAGGLSTGITGNQVETSVATFKELDLGDEQIKNARLRVSDLGQGLENMLIGDDFFLSHRVLLSRTQRRLYFTYSGGPVFRMGERTQVAEGGSEPGTPTAAPADNDNAPKTAEEFERRGDAFSARRDFAAAAEDFGKAIELAPNETRYWRERATARLNNRQPVLAMADLSQALKLKPDDVGALVQRGQLYLSQRDKTAAQADFDAASKLSPNDAGLPLIYAAAFVRARDFEAGVRLYSDWIAAHPKAPQIANVLEQRCRARAYGGLELEGALADCDAALKAGPRTSRAEEGRGFALLRLGRFDEAVRQYDVALRAQPKDAPALYGRGLAKMKLGKAADGQADLDAATAVAPGIARDMKAYGLAPDAPARP